MDCPDPIENQAARLFVYGTLRKGFRAHGLLQSFRPRFLGTGYIQGRLYNLGEYPGARERSGDGDRVHGELYRLPQAGPAFRVLDRFEGFNPEQPVSNEFERKETMVTMAAGGRVRAWIYWHSSPHHSGRQIASGNYALHRK